MRGCIHQWCHCFARRYLRCHPPEMTGSAVGEHGERESHQPGRRAGAHGHIRLSITQCHMGFLWEMMGTAQSLGQTAPTLALLSRVLSMWTDTAARPWASGDVRNKLPSLALEKLGNCWALRSGHYSPAVSLEGEHAAALHIFSPWPVT